MQQRIKSFKSNGLKLQSRINPQYFQYAAFVMPAQRDGSHCFPPYRIILLTIRYELMSHLDET